MALDFAAGCFGGAAGVLVGYPFDTVKVRIQTQNVSQPKLKYTSTFQCLNTIVKEEGASALYRGMSSPLAGVAAINAIGFGVYGNVVRRLPDPDSIASVTLAGTVAGFFQALICGPMELVKTQMQVGDADRCPRQVIRDIVSKAGPAGLTRGLGLTIFRELPGCGLYFGTYELLVRGHEDNTALVFASGGVGGILSWILTYPQDVIKSRIQADTFGPEQKYKGALHCLRESLKNEGPKVMVRGMGSTIARAFPTNAATMGTATMIIRTFSEDKDIKVYDTMARLRTAHALQVDLPPSVERYFDHRAKKFRYLPNISTLATDGPDILTLSQASNSMVFSPIRLYANNMLNAAPSKFYERHIMEPGDVEVGTIRTNVNLSVLYRVFERKLNRRKNTQKILQDNSHEAFADNHGEDFIILTDEAIIMFDGDEQKNLNHNKGGHKKVDPVYGDTDGIMTPSLLAKDRSQNQNHRSDKITTSDFLIPSTLLRNNNDSKIYGFYYLVC